MNSPAFSDRPANMDRRHVTIADVLMRFAHDGPIYATVALVGALAVRSQASTTELLMTTALGLLARSWPRPIQIGGGAVLALFFAGRLAIACEPALPLAVKDIVEVTDYSLALDRCRLEGKDAGRYEAYETCAEAADRKFGRKDAAR